MDDIARKKQFPSYLRRIVLPDCAREQSIEVYRACRTGRIERESFLNSYEENGFRISAGGNPEDPQEYCLSAFARLKDIRRFVVIDSKYQPPWLLAKGTTDPAHGISCKTSEWKKTKSSHVDWWLYENAEPWNAFEETEYDHEKEHFPAKR